jgi:hypothetical protein
MNGSLLPTVRRAPAITGAEIGSADSPARAPPADADPLSIKHVLFRGNGDMRRHERSCSGEK